MNSTSMFQILLLQEIYGSVVTLQWREIHLSCTNKVGFTGSNNILMNVATF